MDSEHTTLKAYCNCLAMDKGLDPGGYAGNFDDAVLIETPLPWNREIYHKVNPLPQEALALMALWMQRYHETGAYRHRPLLIAPDAEYSRTGYRRVMFYTRTTDKIATFDKVEYSVPQEALGGLLWAFFEAREDLPRFEAYRTPDADNVRDILVCTHGTIDAACAKFGYPLYHALRHHHTNEALRVWRVSHFGGHVFAPTLIDMPTGHYWAYVEETQARQIVMRCDDVAALRGHYRGWAGVEDGFLQAAERELWQMHGWDWFVWPKRGVIVLQDADTQHPTWAEVRIEASTPDGTRYAYALRVEVSRYIETITSTGNENTHRYPQYTITQKTRLT